MQQAPTIFHQYDKNKDGRISMDEMYPVIKHVFAQLGLGEPFREDMRDLMHAFKKNKDGSINMTEFRRMLRALANGGED